MKKYRYSFTFFIFLFFIACSHKRGLRQTGDKDMTVQLVDISNTGVKDDISYGARVTPSKVEYQTVFKSSKENLMYRMDSCFYLQKGATIVYAQMVQPVANGLSGTFEYLLSFDVPDFDEQQWDFVYRDKYLNKKKYILKLSE